MSDTTSEAIERERAAGIPADYAEARKRISELEAVIKLAQEALLKWEYIWDEGLLSNYCPFCDGFQDRGGHTDDCLRQAALRAFSEALGE